MQPNDFKYYSYNRKLRHNKSESALLVFGYFCREKEKNLKDRTISLSLKANFNHNFKYKKGGNKKRASKVRKMVG